MPIGWEQLASGVALPLDDVDVPLLTEIELPAPGGTPVGDVESAARSAVIARLQLSPGTSVAVGASSRGLSGRVEVLRGAIAGLRDLGALPFVVPAMGSHGGATADGQLATLARLGITEDGDRRRDQVEHGDHRRGHRGGRRGRVDPRPPRPACGSRRRDPSGEPHQAAHAVPRSGGERPGEDGRCRLRQAIRRRRLPCHRAEADEPPAGCQRRRAPGDGTPARRRWNGRGRRWQPSWTSRH